jgi:hypothetical protein
LQKLQVVDDFVVVEAVQGCRSAGFSGTQGGMLLKVFGLVLHSYWHLACLYLFHRTFPSRLSLKALFCINQASNKAIEFQLDSPSSQAQ